MSYYSYKTKLTKAIAMLMVSMLLIGVSAPVVFAEEAVEQETIEEGKEEQENGELEESGEDTEDVKPLVWDIGVYPESTKDYIWFNQETLYHSIRDANTRNRLFLKVSFSIDEGELSFRGLEGLMNGVTVFSDSSNTSMVDIEFLNDINNMETDHENPENDKRKKFIDKYIFIEGTTKNRATLYVPIKPLMSHMKYSVTLSPDIVYDVGTYQGNDSITWNFNTMAIPSVAENDVIVQSVIEDYDVSEPIIITGKFFYSPTVEVYFNNIRAYRVWLREDNEGEEYLEVYLPRGRNRLEPGLYDITVENSYNHSKWLYGTLSVVSEADGKIPVEDNNIGTTTNYGVVSGARRIESIRLDHAEPIKNQILRKQLAEYILRSPLVEVESRDYSVYTFALEIPIEQGLYENYKVLRYDELSRSWMEESYYYINKIDQRVVITSFKSGIFVVVESKH